MTAVVGLVHDGRVHLGADSAGVSGWSLTVRADEKVFATGEYVMGFTSSFRMGQLLRYGFTPPAPEGDLPRFMVTTFIDAGRESLKTGGYATKSSEQEFGGTFLVGIRGRLFEIHNDYQVGEPADQIAAVGCGFEVALGALYATAATRTPVKRRILTALSAAERFNAGVRGPFALVSSKKTP
jgi:ATP-dependent protease HslVU (ClpYQ) peptidase subunit